MVPILSGTKDFAYGEKEESTCQTENIEGKTSNCNRLILFLQPTNKSILFI